MTVVPMNKGKHIQQTIIHLNVKVNTVRKFTSVIQHRKTVFTGAQTLVKCSCIKMLLLNRPSYLSMGFKYTSNISAIMLCVFYQLFRIRTSMPDSQMNHSFDRIGHTDLQKDLKLFAIQFDEFGQFNYSLNHLPRFLTLKS